MSALKQEAIKIIEEIQEDVMSQVVSYLKRMADKKELEETITLLQKDTIQTAPSAFGIAHKYANLDFIEKEKEAFKNAMLKKHSNS